MRKIVMACLCLAILSLPNGRAAAMPALQAPATVSQPDGEKLQVRIRGDEHQNWTELDATGYTIVRNPGTKVWEYAEKRPDGSLKPSGIRAHPAGKNAPPSLKRGLKPERKPQLDRQMTPPMKGQELQAGAAPAAGDRKLLVVLVNFSDRSLVTSAGGWYGTLFDTTPGVKSMANFYHDNSYGEASVSPALHGQAGNPPGIVTVTLTAAHPSYGGNISFVADLSIGNDALAQAASFVDFQSFDTNADGELSPSELVVYFIYAGYEASGSVKTPGVWAHAWQGVPLSAGPASVRYWGVGGELNDAEAQHPVGVIVHELGHAIFGLIDLYDTSGVNQGLGNFSAMATGGWGFDLGEYQGTTPTDLDLWSRKYLGWALPRDNYPRSVIEFPPPLSSPDAGLQAWHPTLKPEEYFLAENRPPVSWDRGLRGYFGSDWLGGLLILHVDDAVPDNRYNPAGHQRVVPVQANTAVCDMLAPGSFCRGDRTTLFYRGNNSNWGPFTTPNSDYYDGTKSGLALTDISPPREVMTAFFDPDAIPPEIVTFSLPATSTSLTVPITLTATDNVAVTGYLVSENPQPSGPFLPAPPTSYTFDSPGRKTLYAVVVDEAGNRSQVRSATVLILGGDTTAPKVTHFILPAVSSSLTVPIVKLSATDDVKVTGYLLSESPRKPAADDPRWSSTKPTRYTFATTGKKTLYAFAKDAAGNVSAGRPATVTITRHHPHHGHHSHDRHDGHDSHDSHDWHDSHDSHDWR